ncbi:MAG TPA: hypothetical protein VEK33_13420 [Terriglobales bacterium]|nr:hypothetical protein [Terriglobales bacterium]
MNKERRESSVGIAPCLLRSQSASLHLASLHFAALGRGRSRQLGDGLLSIVNQCFQEGELRTQCRPQLKNGIGELSGIVRRYDFRA